MRVTRALAVAGLAAAIATTTAPAAMGAQDDLDDLVDLVDLVDLDEASQRFERHVTSGKTLQAPASSSRSTPSSQSGDAMDAAVTYRVYGDDRIKTALDASTAWDSAQAVVLSRSDSYADALGGSALAGAAEAPLLLNPTATLRADVEAEIIRLLGTETPAGTVYVLGGDTAIAPAVTDRLSELGYSVLRLAGDNRYETSVEIAKQTAALTPTGLPQFVLATTGLNFPDGLAAGATAGGYWASVVLTRDDEVPGSVATYLDEMVEAQIPIAAVGGAAASASAPWTAEFVGVDRYQTAKKVAEFFWADADSVDDDPIAIGLSTGLNWPDALAGGAYVASAGPLLLSKTASLPGATSSAVSTLVASAEPPTVGYGIVFGGPDVVTDDVLFAFDELLNPAP